MDSVRWITIKYGVPTVMSFSYTTGATVVAIVVLVWVCRLFHLWFVVLPRYDRAMDAEGLTVAAAVRHHPPIAEAVAEAVVYTPVVFTVCTYNLEAEVGAQLTAEGWSLRHWHRPNPTILLCVRGGEAVLAFRGTDTPEDVAVNRSVWGAGHHTDGFRFRMHNGVRTLLAGYLSAGGALSDPNFRAALRSSGAYDRLTVVGYSLGGSVAVALAVLLRNPQMAPAFGLSPKDVSGLCVDAGGLAGGLAVHCVAFACPPVYRFGRQRGRQGGPDLRNITTVIKEGDAVPLLSLANVCGAAGLPFPCALRHTGPVLVVRDEEWRGRSVTWLAANRSPLPSVRLYYAAMDDSALRATLLGRAALFRAAPAAFTGLTLARPLHTHERWRTTMVAVSTEVAAVEPGTGE